MLQPQQQFAQTQQQNWGMGSMNEMSMGDMQNMQHMQHRYPGERERERGRERDRTRDSGGVRGGDIDGYRRDNHGQKKQGPSRRKGFEINMRIAVCENSRALCALIDARAAEFNHVVTAPHTWPHTPACLMNIQI
jgi:hypothetical protein